MKSSASPRILVVRLSSLGDVILASSVPRALKSIVPEAHVSFLTKDTFTDVFENNPDVDDIIPFSEREDTLSGILRIARELRSRRFDLIVDLQANPRTNFLCLLLLPRRCVRADRDALARHAMVRLRSVRLRRVRHSVQRYLSAVEKAFGPVPATRPRVFLTEEEKALAAQFVRSCYGEEHRPIVGVCPGAKWKTKMWGAQRMGLLVRRLVEAGFNVSVLGGEVDEVVLQQMKPLCGELEGVGFYGGSLRSLAALMGRCSCVVSNDSGLMHMAHSVGTPVVAILGSTVPEFGFYPPDSRSAVISRSFQCKPCDVHGKQECKEGDMRCMDSIKVSDVLAVVEGTVRASGEAGCGTSLRLGLPRFVLEEGEPCSAGREWSIPKSGPVAVRVPNWIGDAVMASPSLAALRKCTGGLRIVAITHERVAGLFEDGRLADEVLRVRGRGALGLLRTTLALRKKGCTTAVAMPDSFSSALMLWLGGVKRVVGFKGELRDRLLDVGLTRERWSHLCEQYAQLLPRDCTASERFSLTPGTDELDRVRSLLSRAGVRHGSPPALLAPGATYGETKRWPEESYVRLATLLSENAGLQVVLVGSRGESELCGRIAEACSDSVANVSGQTNLRELAALASLGALFVGNDSGAAHVAAASGCPAVVIFGSSDPSWTAPRGDEVRVIYKKLSCSPCFRKHCSYQLQCLRQIEPEEVYEAAMEVRRDKYEQNQGGRG